MTTTECTLILLLCTLASVALAEEARTVIHDGTVMMLSRVGDGLEIAYGADVPPELRELGVTAGTLLVRGKWNEDVLVGEAYAFSPECKSIAYPIRGIIDRGGALIVVGPVPSSCKAESYSWDKAVIKFTQPLAPASRLVRAEKKKTKPKPEPKPKQRVRAAPRQQPAPQLQPQPYWQQQWRW